MQEERHDQGSGAVIYVIRSEDENADEIMEREWDFLQRYCEEEGLAVRRVITERIEDCYVHADDVHRRGGYLREIDFEKRPGGQSVLESFEGGAAHLVLGTIDGLNDDPRRAGSLIRRLQETGVTVHLVARLTPSDAAEYFGIPTDQVRKWLREGEVEGYKDGGRWLVNQRSLLDFIIESPESDAGAVVYVIRPQNEGADETVEQEWDYLRSYCDAKSLTVLRVIVERAEHCWETVHGTDGVGEGWRETSFEMRPGGQSAMEGLQNGGEHLVLGHANGLSRDPRRATLLIREIEQTGVLVHLVAALTPNEAAGYFDVSGDQVRRWLRNASIDGDKDGGRWFVNQRSLVDYIAFRDQWAEERARDERTQGWVDAAGIALTVLWKTVSWWGHRKRHDTG